MKKIFIFNPLALENGRGGEISAIELASGLQKYYNITLIDTNIFIDKTSLSSNAINEKLKGLRRKNSLKFANLKLINRTFTFPYPKELFRLFNVIKESDVIYSSNYSIKMNIILVLFGLINRKTKFIIGHRKPLYSEKVFSFYNLKSRVSIILFSLFKKRFLHHTISEHAKVFLDNFFNPNRVIHITHGVDLEDYKEKYRINKSKEVLNFIYVGYLDEIHKGVGVLLDGIEKVIRENPDLKIHFEFCGAGPLEVRLNLLEKEFPDFIKFNGYVSNKEISEYYYRNDVFLFTSHREPFGRVLVEALASKLLIICTKTYGSMEILKRKRFAYFINQLNTKNVKMKILEVYKLWEKNLDNFRELQELAKTHAYQNYSFSKELEMFKKIIDRISPNNKVIP